MTVKEIMNFFKRTSKYKTGLKILNGLSESVRHNGQKKKQLKVLEAEIPKSLNRIVKVS
jgi:hypothetical protein